MRYRCNVSNSGNVQSRPLQGAYRCFTAAARTINKYFNLPQTVHHSLARRITGCHLRCVRRAFTRTLESSRPGASPGQRIPLRVCKSYDSIVETRLYISLTGRNCFAFPPSCFSFPLLWHPVLLIPVLSGLFLRRAALLASAGNCLTLTALGTGVSPCPLSSGR